ncbi:MAG: ATP-binding cassette domain-containing protein [Proteobacteria bacterium]|nr:ATP-binding cassette domain-containing protein [Pseudomonadota bacterium]
MQWPKGVSGVRFAGVSLEYPGGPPVLKGLDFALEPGIRLGVVGRTGCGKSSLARLLLRFYKPTAGSVQLINGSESVDLHRIPLNAIRRHIGLVTQEVQLFAASVRDNLTLYGAISDRAEDRLVWALTEVGLDTWLRGLPHGIDTPLLGADGSISAGQAQLLALARVFLQNPRILILDEPSSRLDPATQSLLERSIHRLLMDRTAIVIAHHLSTLRRMDKVLVLDGGEIVEFGDRASLETSPASHFYGLLHPASGRIEDDFELGES